MKTPSVRFALWVVFGALVFAPVVASAQGGAYMSVTTKGQGMIQGACTERRHEKWIELEQVNRGAAGQVQAQQAGRTFPRPGPSRVPPRTRLEQADVQTPEQPESQGQPQPQQRPPESLKVVKQADIASALLQQELRRGTALHQVVIEFVGPANQGKNGLYQRLTLEGVRILSLSQRYQGGKYTEELTFSYDRFRQEDFDDRGGSRSTGWDFRVNRPW